MTGIDRRSVFKFMSLPAVAALAQPHAAWALLQDVYYVDPSYTGAQQDGSLQYPFASPAKFGWTIPAGVKAVYFKRGTSLTMASYLRVQSLRSGPLTIGAYGSSNARRPILRAAVPCTADDFAPVVFDGQVPPGAGSSSPPTVKVIAGSTSYYWQFVGTQQTASQSAQYFRFWGAFGDGRFGVQVDPSGTATAGGVLPGADPKGGDRQWGYCSHGHVLYSGTRPTRCRLSGCRSTRWAMPMMPTSPTRKAS